MRAALACGLLALGASASAQVETAGPQTVCTLEAHNHGAHPFPASGLFGLRQRRDACVPDRADFVVTYVDFPAEAEVAFQAAVDAWSCQLDIAVPVRIEATWETLGPGTLGSAGPRVIRNFDGAPSPDVWYPAALADQLAGRDLTPDVPDIEATFNRAFPAWNLDPEATEPERFDLYTVVLHEIAHGLGFIGALRVEGGVGIVGENGSGPYAFDLQTQDGAGVSLLNSQVYPPGSARLADALTRPVAFRGRTAEAAGLGPIPLYAPSVWLPGGSYSHLDEEAFPGGTPDGALSPFISRGEAAGLPGPATCAVLADVGWTLEGTCAASVGRLGSPDARLEVVYRGPNPARSSTRIEVRSEVSRFVSAEVRDARGRRVADLGTAALTQGRVFDIRVDVDELASGVYFIVVRGGPSPQALPLTVVRG